MVSGDRAPRIGSYCSLPGSLGPVTALDGSWGLLGAPGSLGCLAFILKSENTIHNQLTLYEWPD